MEIRKSHCAWDGKRMPERIRRDEGTPKKVQKENERRARETLRWSIAANFGWGDYHLVLTFIKKLRPGDEATLIKIVQRFLRKMRRIYKKNCAELKYIWAAGIGERGGVHVHLICNSAVSLAATQALWEYGMVRASTLNDRGEYEKLANYLIGHFKVSDEEGMDFFKRWNSSRNLIKPTVKIEEIKARLWREEIRVPSGYYLDRDSVRRGVDAFGFGWMEYRLLKIVSRSHRKKAAA